jgi:hypothetical protein
MWARGKESILIRGSPRDVEESSEAHSRIQSRSAEYGATSAPVRRGGSRRLGIIQSLLHTLDFGKEVVSAAEGFSDAIEEAKQVIVPEHARRMRVPKNQRSEQLPAQLGCREEIALSRMRCDSVRVTARAGSSTMTASKR